MRKEDYQKIITDLEIHYQEFLRNSQGSEMFGDEDKRKMQTQFTDAQKHYQTLIIQLPNQPRQPQPGLLSPCFLADIVLLGFLSLEWKRRGCIFTLWKSSHKHIDKNVSKNCNCCLPVKQNWPCTGRGMFSFLPSMAVNLGIVLWSSWNLVGKGEGFNPSVMFSVVRKQNLTTAFEEASLFFSEGETSLL